VGAVAETRVNAKQYFATVRTINENVNSIHDQLKIEIDFEDEDLKHY